MMAVAASRQNSGLACFTMPASRCEKRDVSSGSPITPVEARKISFSEQPAAAAPALPVRPVDSRPLLPVKALALPELTISSRAFPPARFWRHQSTGAEGHLERVKTPATSVPSSNTMASTSVRFLYLMPASAVAMRTPSISGIFGYFFGASGEIVADIWASVGGARERLRLPDSAGVRKTFADRPRQEPAGKRTFFI